MKAMLKMERLKAEAAMQTEVLDSLLRTSPYGSVCVTPSATPGKRLLCATLAAGYVFRATNENTLQVLFRPGGEERAKAELLRQVRMGVIRTGAFANRRKQTAETLIGSM